MKLISRYVAIATLLALGACSPAPPPVAAPPTGDERFIVDPRAGYAEPVAPALDDRFETAWRHFLAGNDAEATRAAAEIRRRNPSYLPASLLEAAQMVRDQRFDEAARIVEPLLQQEPGYTAARIYDAEITLARGDVRGALTRYRGISAMPSAPPIVAERLVALESRLYTSIVADAAAATGDARVALLREAISMRPSENDPRISLAEALVATQRFDDARGVLDPVLNSSAVDRAEVQSLLAEIDVSRGRYQEAIVRLDRLSRRTGNAAYAQRLQQVKTMWSRANMPPQYTRARDAAELTRADLAVLAFWLVKPVRFAQNLSTPPIAVDLGEVSGRDEIIRSIALGLYDVDPITRRVSPGRVVTTSAFTRYAARLLMVAGAPCARTPQDGGETARALRTLAACGVTDAIFTMEGDSAVSGGNAVRILDQVDRVLSR